jgi:hypothetical protein
MRELRRSVWLGMLLLGPAMSAAGREPPDAPAGATPPVIQGVTFVADPGVLYAPVRELGEALGLPVRWDGEAGHAYVADTPISRESSRRLPDGTLLVPVRALAEREVSVAWSAEEHTARLTRGHRAASVVLGPKRVEINRKEQRMRAWQGERLVLDTRVSTGRRGQETPRGSFRAGPYRARMHYSGLYDNAPMPWSVQVQGHIFIHGYHSVPPRAASHGCIRVPLTGANPARWFFRWIDSGTPIRIADEWSA